MNFRFWLREKWFEHLSELESYGEPITYSAQEYFAKYKYWLKREFKFQRSKA